MTDRAVAGPRLTADFFDRPVLDVAVDLLGCLVAHDGVAVRLTEVEAYAGEDDPGSHAYRGPTPRTEVMFGPPGALYVYFTYGMHFCANLVCGPTGRARAVLLRAGEVVAGEEVARLRRAGDRDPATLRRRDLARGPARLAQALALGRGQNGLDVTAVDSPFQVIAPDRTGARPEVLAGARVGVGGEGGDAQAYPWRFWLAGEPTVSAYRPAARRTATVRRAKAGPRGSEPPVGEDGAGELDEPRARRAPRRKDR